MHASDGDPVRGLAERLRPAGLDLVQPLAARWYDDVVAPAYRLPRLAGRSDALAVVIGNSAALWTPFRAWLAADGSRAEEPDPIDRYVTQAVTAALAGLEIAHQVRFSYESPPRRVAMQRLAHVAGLATLTPAMLCVHPVYGPWIALRAAIVLDAAAPAGDPPPPPVTCADCATHCAPALARAQAASAPVAGHDDPVAGQWRLWLAVRESCPIGRAHRYPEPLLRYVYTKDRAVLRAALAGDAP